MSDYRRPLASWPAAVAALWLSACASPRATPAPVTAAALVPIEARLYEHTLRAAELDPAADKFPAPQFAYLDGRAPRVGRLVVYLVGAKNIPERGREMGQVLAGMGFHVVIPGYANDYDIRALCEAATATEEDCHGRLRLEAFEGVDHSPHIAISRANGIEARVARMLTELDKRQPGAGWGAFLAGGEPRWEEIIVAGHSHGSSSSALIAKYRKIYRAVILSGPYDNHAGEPASWLSLPSKTPIDRYYAFSHTNEEQHAGHLKDWNALGLPALGPVVQVESSAPPYGGSHQLVTSLPPAGGGNPHGTTDASKASPRMEDGTYRFIGVWRYLFGL